MGTDIHMITQIKKDGKWKTLEETPKTLEQRNYSTFSALAGVRDSFQGGVFEPKGLPEDLEETKFNFSDEIDYYRRIWEENTEKSVELPDGTFINVYDKRLMIECSSEEEMKLYPYHCMSKSEGICRYFAYDPSVLSGKIKDVPYKKLYPDFEEFCRDRYGDEWDEDMQSYGWWKIDFSCEDYHTPSWLTLKELIETDKSNYTKNKAKIPAQFFNAFLDMGGQLPDGMNVIKGKDRIPGSIMDAIYMSINPDVIITWDAGEEDEKEMPLMKGIEELKEIAKKYGMENEPGNVRIVFAFDN